MIKKCKKISLIISLFLLNSLMVKAQQEVGGLIINAGIGAGTYLNTTSNLLRVVVPPLSISADYGVWDEYGPGIICLGGYFGYVGIREEYTNPINSTNYGYEYDILSLGARVTYFYPIQDGLDVYAGILAGYYMANKSYYGTTPSLWTANPLITPNVAYGMFAGANYLLNKDFGVFAELGYGINHFRIGVSLNL